MVSFRCFLLFCCLFLSLLWGQGTRHYLFLSDQRVVTIELIDPRQAILNYINLSNEFQVILAPYLVVLDGQGRSYRGHVLEDEEAEPQDRFKASDLLGPGQFRGYTVLGDFRFDLPPAKAYFLAGSAILSLEPLSAHDFERAAAKISEIDLSSGNLAGTIRRAGLTRGYGVLTRAGTEEARDLERYFPALELLGPVLLANPRPRLPASAAHLPDPVLVKIKALVGRTGVVSQVEVVEGINPALDAIAVETVRNSWEFLPAIAQAKVAQASVVLNVIFERGSTPQSPPPDGG